MHAADAARGGYLSDEEEGEEEEGMDRQPYINTNSNSTSTRPSGPLAARPLNVAPVLRHKRRSPSLYSIPAPEFSWEGQPPEQHGETQERGVVDSEEPASAPASRAQLWRTSSASSVSATRRSSVIGPDPRDCIDLPDSNGGAAAAAEEDEEEPQQMQVVPLPHEFYRRPPPPAAVAADLSALVNAPTVDRCRSDSRGQILLVDSADLVGKRGEVASQDRRRGREDLSSVDNVVLRNPTRSASLRAPTELTGEEEEEQELVQVGEREGGVEERDSPPSAAFADLAFVQDYFYYPSALHLAAEAGEVSLHEEDAITPARGGYGSGGEVREDAASRRRASASPSSSMPRWARFLAEETPFTPFTFTPQCPAAASSVPSPSVMPHAPHPATAGEDDISVAAAADHHRVSVLDDVAAAVGVTAAQRLTMQEVVVAVLSAPPPLPPAVQVREVALEMKGVDVDVDGDGPLDEPMPRKPEEGFSRKSPHTSSPPPQQQQQQQLERKQLMQRVEGTRARLSHVDQLTARFDAVIAARQAELETLTEKHRELTQQAESHRVRAAMARKEVRRLRDRQHTREELQLLQDMLVDKENQLGVAQSQLLSLKRLRQQLDLLHSASCEKSQLASEGHRIGAAISPALASAETTTTKRDEPTTAMSKLTAPLRPPSPPPSPGMHAAAAAVPTSPPPPLPTAIRPLPPTIAGSPTVEAAEVSVTAAAKQQELEVPPRRSASSASSSESSLASLDTCDIMDDFLEELLMEVDGLAKVCIQLPSPPPAMSYCSRMSRAHAAASRGEFGNKESTHAGPSRRARPTYSALNRRLNDGNNGFFSFFGGATEAHLNSKPLSTFLANLDRLARSSWELEEEVQLRAREIATDGEEEELRARLMAEYGLDGGCPPGTGNATGDGEEAAAKSEGTPQGPLLSPATPLQPTHTEEVKDELLLCDGADPLAATASSDRTTRQLFFSSPEHGRRSRGGGGGNGNSSGGLPSPSGASLASPMLRRPTSVSLLLPTLVYAYPRVAAISQHLDDEQQQIQKDYAATIATARQQRRELTSRMREVFRLHVAPALQKKIDALKQQQASLARELSELGVKEVTLEWEEEEPEMPDGAALWQLMDAATAAGRRRWFGTRRRGGNRSRSHSHHSIYSAGPDDDSGYGDGNSSRGLSCMRGDGESARHEPTSLSRVVGNPVWKVYRRTLHMVCEAPVEEEGVGPAMRGAVAPASPRSGRQSRQSLPKSQSQPPRHHRHTRGSAEEGGGTSRHGHGRARSARSARRRPSAGSGRRSSRTAGPVADPSSTVGASLVCPDQSVHSTTSVTSNKTCAVLQLYTHSPSQHLLQLAARHKHSGSTDVIHDTFAAGSFEEGTEAVAAAVKSTASTSGCGSAVFGPSRPSRTAPLSMPSLRRSGGTPRVSSAPTTSSATTRTSTTSDDRTGAMAPPSPRHRRASSSSSQLVGSSRLQSGRHLHRHNGDTAAPFPAGGAGAAAVVVMPVVCDTRVRLSTDLASPQGGVAVSPTATATTTTTTGAAGVLWSPFEPAHDALAEGAVHVVLTFTGAEAHRRQVAQERREVYQRQFWQLREELARIDEDIFQLRTKHADLCALQQRTEEEQAQKLAEAEAKVKKCRAFYKALKRENKEWQDICNELQRVIREGE
jgi:hypothetical protein